MGNHQGCIAESQRIRSIIESIVNPTQYNIITIPNSYAFRVRFGSYNIGLSISCPADINTRSDENGFRYETAIWNFTEGNLLYREEWNYDDVLHFTTINDLMDEIVRVRLLVLNQVDVPDAVENYQVPAYSSESESSSNSDIPPSYDPDIPPDYNSDNDISPKYDAPPQYNNLILNNMLR